MIRYAQKSSYVQCVAQFNFADLHIAIGLKQDNHVVAPRRYPGGLPPALGDSRTGVYSYEVWLWRVPIVVTVDLSAAWNPAEPWIQANSLHVFLDRGCWVDRVEIE